MTGELTLHAQEDQPSSVDLKSLSTRTVTVEARIASSIALEEAIHALLCCYMAR